MAYTNIWLLKDEGNYAGGKIYDRWGNLSYFVATDSLTDVTKTGKDVVSTVKGHSRSTFMGAKSKSSVASHSRYSMQGVRQTKGAIPGYTVTFVGGDEKRQFQFTGSMSALVAYVKENAKVTVTLFGPTGTPYDPISPKAQEAQIAKALMPS